MVFALPTQLCFAQILVKAVICNSKKKPLLYTNVALLNANNIGTSTDENGAFELKCPGITDSIKVSNIAYRSRFLSVRSVLNKDTIFLTEAIKSLDQVLIKPQKLKEKELGYFKLNTKASYALMPGNQIATFIPNKKNTGWINGVYFKIKSKGACKNSMRVRLMATGAEISAPFVDLLHENVIVNASDLRSNNYIDLSKYAIQIPKEGVFVVLEWLSGSVKCDQNSFVVLSGNTSIDQNLVWFNSHDNKWVRSGFHQTPNGNYMTPNVGIMVAY
jgi:hypothetical protein